MTFEEGEEHVRIKCYTCDSETTAKVGVERKNCPECGSNILVTRGKVAFRAGNKAFDQLAKGPTLRSEISSLSFARPYVERLKAPGSTTTSGGRGGMKARNGGKQTEVVCYFPGDERAAMRLFCDVNERYVASCMEDHSNPLQRNWREWKWNLLLETWYWYKDNEVRKVGPE